MSCRPGTAFRPRPAGVCRPAAPGGASAARPEEREARRSVGGSPARVLGFRPASAALLGNTSNVEFGIRRSVLSRRRSIAHAAAGADADATARAQLLLEVDGVELHGAVRLAISGAATCNVLETDTDYAERRANAELDGPVQAFLLVQNRQGVGQPGPDRHRLRGGERPVRQTILQRAAARRSPAERRPRRGAVPPRRFVRQAAPASSCGLRNSIAFCNS